MYDINGNLLALKQPICSIKELIAKCFLLHDSAGPKNGATVKKNNLKLTTAVQPTYSADITPSNF